MLKSYFFIPGNHPKLISKIGSIEANEIIVDLEDSVKNSDFDEVVSNLGVLGYRGDIWFRPSLTRGRSLDLSSITFLMKAGFRKFVIPKINNFEDFEKVESLLLNKSSEIDLLILIENAWMLQKIEYIIENCKLKLHGVGFGSHDYCLQTGMMHRYELLLFPRLQIMNIAKAHNILCIDIACMDIDNKANIEKEIQQAFQMGYDGKFFIHPNQLSILDEFVFYSKDELEENENILTEYIKLGEPSVFNYRGRTIEPPHIAKYLEIKRRNNKS